MSATILLVEDDPVIVTLLSDLLTDDGYRVLHAVGVDALLLARTEQPAVVLLDLMLPVLSGTAILQALHEDSRTAHIPVIVVTAVPDKTEATHDLGAYATLHKPFRIHEVLSVVRNALAR